MASYYNLKAWKMRMIKINKGTGMRNSQMKNCPNPRSPNWVSLNTSSFLQAQPTKRTVKKPLTGSRMLLAI